MDKITRQKRNLIEELIEFTEWDDEFIGILKHYKVLGSLDAQELEQEKQRNGERASVRKLYQILIMRENSTLVLMHALTVTHQHIAMRVLLSGGDFLSSITQAKKSFHAKNSLTRYENSVEDSTNTLTKRKTNISNRKPSVTTLYGKLSWNEATQLLNITRHENVLSFILTNDASNGQTVYGETFSQYSLDQLIKDKPHAAVNISNFDVMSQVTKGISHLHSHNITHRDLRPQNILLDEVNKTASVRIANYGLVNGLAFDNMGLQNAGWMAPEILARITETTGDEWKCTWSCAADIFSLGLVFYYVLSGGSIPFKIENGTIHHNKNLTLQKGNVGLNPIIKLMTATNPAERPSASAVLSYHIFRSRDQKLQFILSVSRCLSEISNDSKLSQCQIELETHKELIWSKNLDRWLEYLCPHAKRYVIEKGNNNTRNTLSSVCGLINTIAEIHTNLDTLSHALRKSLGANAQKFMKYWNIRFPYLFHYTWLVFQKVKHDPNLSLSKFYPPSNDGYVFPQLKPIQNISYDTASIIGSRNGSVVFKGKFNMRDAIVKRIPISSLQEGQEESLRRLKHENLTRIFCVETDYNTGFVYKAAEPCDANLRDWVKSRGRCIKNMNSIIRRRDILAQITKGLAYLHQNNMAHGNLKPENILVQRVNMDTVQIKISDFGETKTFSEGSDNAIDDYCKQPNAWLAPEILTGQIKLDDSKTFQHNLQTAGDIFSVGCLFYYVITAGLHPFNPSKHSDPFKTQQNILENKLFLSLDNVTRNFHGDMRLIQRMISKDPSNRPSAHAILCHHIFWTKEKCLEFFNDIAEITEESYCITDTLHDDLEVCIERANDNYSRALYFSSTGSPIWPVLLSQPFKKAVLSGPVKTNSILGIPKVIKSQKLKDVFEKVRYMYESEGDAFGTVEGGYFSYWSHRFPFLVDNLYANFEKIKRDEKLKKYYFSAADFDYFHVSLEEQKLFSTFIEMRLKKSTQQSRQRQCSDEDLDSCYESD